MDLPEDNLSKGNAYESPYKRNDHSRMSRSGRFLLAFTVFHGFISSIPSNHAQTQIPHHSAHHAGSCPNQRLRSAETHASGSSCW